MRVKAVWPTEHEFGYYDNDRKYDGDEFDLKEESHFSEKWMEWIIPPEKKKPRKKKMPEPEMVQLDVFGEENQYPEPE